MLFIHSYYSMRMSHPNINKNDHLYLILFALFATWLYWSHAFIVRSKLHLQCLKINIAARTHAQWERESDESFSCIEAFLFASRPLFRSLKKGRTRNIWGSRSTLPCQETFDGDPLFAAAAGLDSLSEREREREKRWCKSCKRDGTFSRMPA